MIIFGAFQLLLSQIPDFDRLWFLSIVAAVMSFGYASIGWGLAVGKATGEALHGSALLFRAMACCAVPCCAYAYIGWQLSIGNATGETWNSLLPSLVTYMSKLAGSM